MCFIAAMTAVGVYAAWFGGPDDIPVAVAAAAGLLLVGHLSLVGGGAT